MPGISSSISGKTLIEHDFQNATYLARRLLPCHSKIPRMIQDQFRPLHPQPLHLRTPHPSVPWTGNLSNISLAPIKSLNVGSTSSRHARPFQLAASRGGHQVVRLLPLLHRPLGLTQRFSFPAQRPHVQPALPPVSLQSSSRFRLP